MEKLKLTICEHDSEKGGQCGKYVTPAFILDNKTGSIDQVIADTSGSFLLPDQGKERIVRFTHKGQYFSYWLPAETRRATIMLNQATRPECVNYVYWNARDALGLEYFSNGCGSRNRIEINGHPEKSSGLVSPGSPNYRLPEYAAFLADKRRELLLASQMFSEVEHLLPGADSLDIRFIRQQLLPNEVAFVYRDRIIKEKKRIDNEYRTIAWQYHAVCMNENSKTARLVSTTVYDFKKGKKCTEQIQETVCVKTTEKRLDYRKVERAFALIDAAGFGSLDSKNLMAQGGPIDKEGRQEVLQITHATKEKIYLKKGTIYRAYYAYAPEIFIDKWPEINQQRKVFVKCRNVMRSIK